MIFPGAKGFAGSFCRAQDFAGSGMNVASSSLPVSPEISGE